MFLSTQPYKGTRDFYPEDMRIHQWMFDQMRTVTQSYGYEEYNGPMLEPFDLYAAKTGEEIVNQQLYWLIDQGNRKLALRPEMTPTLARMVASKIHELSKPVRWFSFPNLWRYEKPQRGRLREHWQFNVDVLGGHPLLADVEILNLALDLMRSFHGEKKVQIRVNNRKLIDSFFTHTLGLPIETALKTTKAIDARGKIGDQAYQKWLQEIGIDFFQQETMEQFFRSSFETIKKQFPCEGTQELENLFLLLQESPLAEQAIVFDPTILRGLDYYTSTVFEMYDTSLENPRALFGGGRYDHLLELFGKTKLSGVGFGMGDVTLRNFLETHQLLPLVSQEVDVFVGLPQLELFSLFQKIVTQLRAEGLRVVTSLSVEGFGAQLKMASQKGALYAILLGEKELAEKQVILKNLSAVSQEVIPIELIVPFVKQKIQNTHAQRAGV